MSSVLEIFFNQRFCVLTMHENDPSVTMWEHASMSVLQSQVALIVSIFVNLALYK